MYPILCNEIVIHHVVHRRMRNSKSFRFLSLLFILCLLALLSFVRSEKRVLIIGPTKHEQTIAERFPYKCYFYPLPYFLDTHHNLSDITDQICTYARQHQIDGMISSDDYAGAPLVSICSEKLGLIGPKPLSVLTCQHKYYSRIAQEASVPEATPAYALGPTLPFPCFIKPIKSSFSRYAQQVNSKDEIKMPQPCFFDFFDQLIAHATPFAHEEEVYSLKSYCKAYKSPGRVLYITEKWKRLELSTLLCTQELLAFNDFSTRHNFQNAFNYVYRQ